MDNLVPIVAIITIFSYAAYAKNLSAKVLIAQARGTVVEPEDANAAANRALLERFEALEAKLSAADKSV